MQNENGTTLETVSATMFSTPNVKTSNYVDLNATLADIYAKLSGTPVGTIIANVNTAASITQYN